MHLGNGWVVFCYLDEIRARVRWHGVDVPKFYHDDGPETWHVGLLVAEGAEQVGNNARVRGEDVELSSTGSPVRRDQSRLVDLVLHVAHKVRHQYPLK